jgi:hypothetical protein
MKKPKYFAKELEKIDNGKGYWNYLKIGIFELLEDETEKQIGEYTRNYSTLYSTFHAFKKGDKWYALYSPDYTSTRVMSLPDCKDLGGEDRHGFGFCPTGFYVPWDDWSVKEVFENEDEDEESGGYSVKLEPGSFGFVCGCIWGDDHGWKIQYLDLSNVGKGEIKRDDRFGYITMTGSHNKLKECFDFGNIGHGAIKISCESEFKIDKIID